MATLVGVGLVTDGLLVEVPALSVYVIVSLGKICHLPADGGQVSDCSRVTAET